MAFVAAISGFLSVVLGAFAAHGLKQALSEYSLGIFHTAVQYQMYHSLALLALSAYPRTRHLRWAAYAFIAGILIFSGSLYALAITGIKILGAITPIGGLLFMLGWLLLAWNFKQPRVAE